MLHLLINKTLANSPSQVHQDTRVIEFMHPMHPICTLKNADTLNPHTQHPFKIYEVA